MPGTPSWKPRFTSITAANADRSVTARPSAPAMTGARTFSPTRNALPCGSLSANEIDEGRHSGWRTPNACCSSSRAYKFSSDDGPPVCTRAAWG